MKINFYDTIYQTLSRHPEQVYIRWPSAGGGKLVMDSYTGAAILGMMAHDQQLLEEKKISTGDKVLVAVPVSIELICSVLAIGAAGAIPVLPPAGATALQLLSLLRKQHIKGVLIKKNLPIGARLLLRLLGIRQLLIQERMPAVKLMSMPPVAVAPSQAALISHSSGSTGQPKPIIRSHQVLQAQHQVLKAQFPALPRQRDFPLFPNILLHNLAVGLLSILPALPHFDVRLLDPTLLAQQLQQEEVQTLTGNVYYFQQLLPYLEAHSLRFPAVKALGIGGSPVPDNLLKRLQTPFPEAALYVIYGSSEAEPIAVRQLDTVAYPPQWGYAVGPFCAAIEGRIQVNGQPQGIGEIEVRGPHVVPRGDGGWLKTGDFGYLNEQGMLILTGRQGNERLHQNVQHYQIEHLLLHQEGVEKAAARSLSEGFEVYVQGDADREALLKVLEAHFPKEIILALHYRESFPMDNRHHSKILYPQLS